MLQNLTVRDGFQRAGGGSPPGQGAGLYASVTGTGQLVLDSVYFLFNVVRGHGTGQAYGEGAGAFVLVQDSARVLIERSRFEDNAVVPSTTSSMSARGGGLHIHVPAASHPSSAPRSCAAT
jgi:hypothetical protein